MAPTHTHSPVDVEFDATRKIIRMHFRGVVTPGDMAAAGPQLQAALDATGSGFVLVTDLSALDEMDLECVPHLARNMDLCLEAGVATILRIIPDPGKDIGFRLLSMTHYRGRVPIATFASVGEADAALAQPRKAAP